MARRERLAHRVAQAGAGLDDPDHLVAPLDRALPGVDQLHAGDDVHAGRELVAHERFGDRERRLLVGEGGVDEKGVVHDMPRRSGAAGLR